MVFAEKRGIKVDSELIDTGLSKSIVQQYVYGCTYRISEALRKEIEPGLVLIGYNYYVYKTLSKPTGSSNRLFPTFFTDTKGKIDSYELNRYPELIKFVHVN